MVTIHGFHFSLDHEKFPPNKIMTLLTTADFPQAENHTKCTKSIYYIRIFIVKNQ
jgi:hypothetical protein